MTRRGAMVGAAVLVVAAATFGVYHAVAGGPTRPATATTLRPSPSAAASATATAKPPALDRLSIVAMRARTYPASTMTQVRSDGDQGGYVNTVVSFVSDGLVEDALMSVPDAPKPAAGWPVIIINHGYIDPTTYRTDDGSYAQFIAAFARAGYMVLKPDYRGHGQSQGVAEGGYVSPVYTYDVLNLVSTLRADARVDPTRIGLFGHSMGGQEALRAMVVSPDLKAVVFMAGAVGSFYDIFYNWPHPPRPTDSAQAVQVPLEEAVITRYGTPLDDPAFWNGASAINFVNATNAAVQINQDAGDSMVPATFADHLAAALHAAGKTYEYTTYPGDDHQFISNRAAILANTLAFYRAHL